MRMNNTPNNRSTLSPSSYDDMLHVVMSPFCTSTKGRVPSPRTLHQPRGLVGSVSTPSNSTWLVFLGGLFTGILLTCFVLSIFLHPFLSYYYSSSSTTRHDNIFDNTFDNTFLQHVQTSRRTLLERKHAVPTILEHPGSVVMKEGWTLGYFFTGNQSHVVDASTIPMEYYKQVQWYSQLRQDYIVSELLLQKQNGYFVDLAANDAIRISNTYALERHYNWTGLCIEPNPTYWSSLSYRKCTLVGAVVGRTRMEEIVFKFSTGKGPKSGIVGPDFDNKYTSRNSSSKSSVTQRKEEQRRSTVTLTEILDMFQAPKVIDYLSLDVEGAEYYALQQFDFDRYQFQLLTIERPHEKLHHLLEQHGYVLLRDLRQWGETLWAHQSLPIDRSSSSSNNNNALLSMDIPKYNERTIPRPKT